MCGACSQVRGLLSAIVMSPGMAFVMFTILEGLRELSLDRTHVAVSALIIAFTLAILHIVQPGLAETKFAVHLFTIDVVRPCPANHPSHKDGTTRNHAQPVWWRR